MKKLFLTLAFIMSFYGYSFAQSYGVNAVISATNATSITDQLTTHAMTRAVWIGTTQSVDFYFSNIGWVTFQGAVAGTIIPIQVVGARITSGPANPNAGDIVFLY